MYEDSTSPELTRSGDVLRELCSRISSVATADDLNNICPIHWETPIDPVQDCCTDRKHIFCRKCIEAWLPYSKKCPISRLPIRDSDLSPTEICPAPGSPKKCIYFSEGCKWTGDLRALKDHLSTSCHYLRLACSNKGCREHCRRSQLDLHETTKCSHRIVKCPYCLEKMQFSRFAKHEVNCPATLKSCPNGCGCLIPIHKLDDHYLCPAEMILCPHGCGTIMQRSALATEHDCQGYKSLKIRTYEVRNC